MFNFFAHSLKFQLLINKFSIVIITKVDVEDCRIDVFWTHIEAFSEFNSVLNGVPKREFEITFVLLKSEKFRNLINHYGEISCFNSLCIILFSEIFLHIQNDSIGKNQCKHTHYIEKNNDKCHICL